MTTWEQRARDLWQILDDIDTLSDMLKETPVSKFEKMALKRAAKRHSILESDGYKLYEPGTLPALLPPPEPSPSQPVDARQIHGSDSP